MLMASWCCVPQQEVFLTSHHLGIAMEYADGGDLSQYIDDQSQQGVSRLRCTSLHGRSVGVWSWLSFVLVC
jgi:hypothetical protein